MARIFFFLVCLLVTWGCMCGVTALEISLLSSTPSPSPSGDCSEVIYNLVECLDFLANVSNETKPNSNCCSGFESMVSTNATCICEAIRSSSSLGLDLNMTKASTLSSACGISAPPLTTCGVTPPSPSKESPAQSPKKSPISPPPSSGGETPAPAPAPSLNNGVACGKIPASIRVSMLVVASFFII